MSAVRHRPLRPKPRRRPKYVLVCPPDTPVKALREAQAKFDAFLRSGDQRRAIATSGVTVQEIKP